MISYIDVGKNTEKLPFLSQVIDKLVVSSAPRHERDSNSYSPYDHDHVLRNPTYLSLFGVQVIMFVCICVLSYRPLFHFTDSEVANVVEARPKAYYR